VEGDVDAWREVLHEGPLTGDRAAFLAGYAGVAVDAVRADFADRERRLAGAAEVVLWFESDLFDVLLMLQILEAVRPDQRVSLALVGQDRWASVAEADIATVRPQPVTAGQRAAARAAWSAFTAPTPAMIVTDTPALPAIGHAMARLLEEYPWAGSGLSRTERQLLEAIDAGARTREAVFMAAVAREERPFLGDTSAFLALDRLAPLLDEDGGLHARGRSVLAGHARWEPLTERWLGGVRLPPGPPPWVYADGAVRRA
jgi:hypothetical protein